MKIKIIILALLCTACREKPLSVEETQNLLRQYTWSYTPPNSDTPIELSFQEGQIGGYSYCNAMGAPYKIIGQKMTAPLFMSDARGCAPYIMQQETFIKSFFEPPVPFKIKYTSSKHPKLIFEKGQKQYIFIGTKLTNKSTHGE
ncbi:META domain-containing protein [Acinetobacter sp. Marseille-Q1618]|uniref:META domain-containing protein n=1 Tax=Acinetobacter sp. Marseille-Q1618 TaxID=2697502 RepID=UPI00156E36B2|nr:META domain-containing protein [Acinetobacter sp. Marseille-Q1618]